MPPLKKKENRPIDLFILSILSFVLILKRTRMLNIHILYIASLTKAVFYQLSIHYFTIHSLQSRRKQRKDKEMRMTERKIEEKIYTFTYMHKHTHDTQPMILHNACTMMIFIPRVGNTAGVSHDSQGSLFFTPLRGRYFGST